MSDKPTEERTTRPFSDFLAEHNAGQGHRTASEALQEVVAAVVETGKKGSITLTVTVEQMKSAEPGTLSTAVTVNAKVPAPTPKAAIFYADDESNLRRSDPRQPAFEGLKDVGERPAPRDVAAPAAPRVVGER